MTQQQAFSTGSDYLNAALSWLHQLLAWQVSLTRHSYGELADEAYRGLYIPDAEVDLLVSPWPELPAELAAERARLSAERAALERRALAAELAGVALPLYRIASLFGLSAFERDVLLLALAPEIDLRYERLYAYIQDDVTKKRPAVELALRLLCPEPGAWLEGRTSFTAGAPLIKHRLIQLFDDGQRQPALLSRFIKLDDRVAAELLGQPVLDPQLATFATLSLPQRMLDTLVLPEQFVANMRQLLASYQGGLVLGLQGGYGSGKSAIAEALCAEAELPLLVVSIERMLESSLGPDEAARRVVREALLAGAAIVVEGASRLLGDESLDGWRLALLAALDDFHGYAFLELDQPWEARGALRRTSFLRIELPSLSYAEREQIWRQLLGAEAPVDSVLQQLASTFRLSGGQIRDAVSMARSLMRWTGRPLSTSELYAACRAQSSGKLDSLAHKIKTSYDWDDIVLPADHVTQMKEICVQVRHRRTVLESWGFDRHLAMGKGVNVLFAGSSGTGKTMAAEIIAADLGLELYKVDLSTMVSKYIGETEKNLDRIFTAAREANAILFFDEADSIFGKRSEVKDAHDRYANIEVGYLLQKMEEYDGVVILATNLRKNLDDAFVRRLHVAIDFPFPEEPDRLRIWQKVFPPEAPLADDVDLAFLAKQFKLPGGNIRNIALLSAFLSAEDGASIDMAHLVRAIKREYQKLGKLVTESDFGPYLALARGTPAGAGQ